MNTSLLATFDSLVSAHKHPEIVRTEFTSNAMTNKLMRYDLLDLVLDSTSGILRGVKIRLKTVSVFDFRDNTEDGQANIYLVNALISSAIDTVENMNLKSRYVLLHDDLLNSANKVTYPYANVTPEQFAAAKAIHAIKKQECVYSTDRSYESASTNQGLDIVIQTDFDCDFVLYLSVCDEEDKPESESDYFPVGGDRPITTPAKSINGKLKIALSSKKVGAFNKLYVKPSMPCVFTANVKTNRG